MSTEKITGAVVRYLDAVANGTADDIAACYAPDGTLEDPVGSEPRRGHAAIREFYAGLAGARRRTELLAIRVAGDSAAFHFHVRTELADQTFEVEPIDVMTFDEEQRITSMRAFWSPGDMRVAR
ncbi:steroid Delta-isomerase [Sphaerisporangium krabiense]|uniref:Steroid delta-isomerase n=1 Tax=Sphaerisporangium krabiense TaxID=763782 RepID=A0A7W9DNA5_9ACTN|nr:nuclear transport factor 2 family protein [Sphaerisporangium krabiense]MBB5625177.1 steroid delta-isomerase [Sphaerisporangium krabiense]GII64315.1 steroid Delta-isomerase [Sphaerisporangium krabiense]